LKKGDRVVGLNTGAGAVFANKAWTEEGYLELIRKLKKEPGTRILLLGGPAERERNRRILKKVKGAVIDTGCDNTLGQFAALIRLCDAVVTGDTTALHLAIGLKKMSSPSSDPPAPRRLSSTAGGKRSSLSSPVRPVTAENARSLPPAWRTSPLGR
jgi:ADP-heptose:LPS heptosyltransferase